MSTFPELTLLDPFASRETEHPLARPEWTKLPWAETVGANLFEEGWTPEGPKEGEDPFTMGAYWNPTQYQSVSAWVWQNLGGGEEDTARIGTDAEKRWMGLWSCVDPAAHNGYRLRVSGVEGLPSRINLYIERVTGGSALTIAEHKLVPVGFGVPNPETPEETAAHYTPCGLTVIGGLVQAWVQSNAGGGGLKGWEVVAEAEDNFFNSGFVAVEGCSNTGTAWAKFEGGGSPISVVQIGNSNIGIVPR